MAPPSFECGQLVGVAAKAAKPKTTHHLWVVGFSGGWMMGVGLVMYRWELHAVKAHATLSSSANLTVKRVQQDHVCGTRTCSAN